MSPMRAPWLDGAIPVPSVCLERGTSLAPPIASFLGFIRRPDIILLDVNKRRQTQS